MKYSHKWLLLTITFLLLFSCIIYASGTETTTLNIEFPKPQSRYQDSHMTSIIDILSYRVQVEPFNFVSLIVFVGAIMHTMFTSWFKKLAHKTDMECLKKQEEGLLDRDYSSILGGVYHLLGEIEVVFGLWGIILAIAITYYYDWETFAYYVDNLHYREPLFILVIMTIASSRPVIKFFELLAWKFVNNIKDSIETWWLTILILSPILGSFITEPAAMTIAAHLLADKFYTLNPTKNLKYGTLALLFVNISIGGSLTNFAAPPILMVAGPWEWSTFFMFKTFGWKAIISILLSTSTYFLIFRKDLLALKIPYKNAIYKKHIQKKFISHKELINSYIELENLVDKRVGFSDELKAYSIILKDNIKALARKNLTDKEILLYDIDNAIDEKFEDIRLEEFQKTIPGLLPESERPEYHDPNWNIRDSKVPIWIMIVHLCFLGWTVANSNDPVLFIAGFLFFLGFYQITSYFQNHIDLKPALLVAFFISGLVIHGTLQAWWIAPLLSNLPELGLNVVSIFLTSFNDNASITYLSTLVPELQETMKYSIVSGAITGGGLTIIANAPNPVGQSILKKYFKTGISSIDLLKFALIPTFITGICFFILR